MSRALAALTLLHIGYGLAQTLLPGQLAAALLHRPATPRLRRVARVLGARHLIQALAHTAWPGRGVLLAGVTVDGLHAVSMVTLALASARWRRAALAEACLATTFTVAGAGAVRGSGW